MNFINPTWIGLLNGSRILNSIHLFKWKTINMNSLFNLTCLSAFLKPAIYLNKNLLKLTLKIYHLEKKKEKKRTNHNPQFTNNNKRTNQLT